MKTSTLFPTLGLAALLGVTITFPTLGADLVQRLSVTGDGSGVTSVAVSPDGGRIATAGLENVVKLWDANTGRQLSTIDVRARGDRVLDIAFSPDGRQIVTGGRDRDSGSRTVTLWNTSSGREAVALSGAGPRLCDDVAFNHDGSRVAAGCWDPKIRDSSLQVWNTRTGRPEQTVSGVGGPVVFSPDGRRLTGGAGKTLTVSDARTGRNVLTLRGDNFICAAYSPDGNRIVSGNSKGELTVWDANSGRRMSTLRGHRGGINDCVFSRDGQFIASAGEDGSLRLWDAATGKQLSEFKGPDPVTAVAFTPQSDHVVGGMGKTVKLLSIITGGPPGVRAAQVAGTWLGPNDENFAITQTGTQITVREGTQTFSGISIAGNTITWGAATGTVTGNTIAWSNHTRWTKQTGPVGPPSPRPAAIAGPWVGPNDENFQLSQTGNRVTIREGARTLATLNITGSTLSWGGVKGTVRGNSIDWANNTQWTRPAGWAPTPVGPPVQQAAQVAGAWTGPNGEQFQLIQVGTGITIREGARTLAIVGISGNTISWGPTKGTVTGNTIAWSNNTTWTRASTSGSTNTSGGPPIKNLTTSTAPPQVTSFQDVACHSKLFLYTECGHKGAKTVELTKQISQVMQCVKDRTFGLNPNGLWVKDGCNGVFRVGF